MKGYQKRVIYLKNTGSQIFDEALFFVKRDGAKNTEYNDMVIEANRIIDESLGRADKRGRGKGRVISFLAPFLLGVLACAAACLLFILL